MLPRHPPLLRIRATRSSLTCALYAALVARLNQSLGKPLGFLNPTLYASSVIASAYRDVTQGNNGAYSAAKGRDACTGWGSIMGSHLLKDQSSGPAPAVSKIPARKSPPPSGSASGGASRGISASSAAAGDAPYSTREATGARPTEGTADNSPDCAQAGAGQASSGSAVPAKPAWRCPTAKPSHDAGPRCTTAQAAVARPATCPASTAATLARQRPGDPAPQSANTASPAAAARNDAASGRCQHFPAAQEASAEIEAPRHCALPARRRMAA